MTFTPKLIENRLNLKVSLIQYRHFQSFLFVLVVYSFFFFLVDKYLLPSCFENRNCFCERKNEL